jgi:hypothetical protein
MNCRELVQFLADYLDGSMDPNLSRELEGHIDLCDSCLHFLRTYDTTRIITREAHIEEIPEEFREKLKSFILEQIKAGSEAIKKYDDSED